MHATSCFPVWPRVCLTPATGFNGRVSCPGLESRRHPMAHEWQRGAFTINTDPARLDVDAVYAYLSASYWARDIPRQVGFARVVTDFATVAYVGDVFVLEGWRGRGLSRWLMEVMTAHPDLQGF